MIRFTHKNPLSPLQAYSYREFIGRSEQYLSVKIKVFVFSILYAEFASEIIDYINEFEELSRQLL